MGLWIVRFSSFSLRRQTATALFRRKTVIFAITHTAYFALFQFTWIGTGVVRCDILLFYNLQNAPGQRRRRLQADVLVPGAAGRRRTLPGRCARIRPYDPQTQGCEARRYAARAGALPSPFELSPETNTRLARQPRFPQTAPRHPQRGRYGARRRRGPARWRTSCSSAGRS